MYEENLTEPIQLLYAEDDPDDCQFFEDGIESAALNADIILLENGNEVIKYLVSEFPTPDVIFLDINMSRVNGLDVLKFIRSHSQFDRIPVIMLTTSVNDEERSYELGANLYFSKFNFFTHEEIILRAMFAPGWQRNLLDPEIRGVIRY